MSGIHDYIKKRSVDVKQHTLFNRIVVYVQSQLPETVNIREVISTLEDRIPQYLMADIDSIFIGQFSFLNDRALSAVYEDGAIYVTNEQENVFDIVSDIVHEVAHSVESVYSLNIYGDGLIETEFLAKRRSMADILHAHGHNEIDKSVFLKPEYSEEFDSYLYQTVGYATIDALVQELFVSPYGSTSLSEYYANVFEEFFIGDTQLAKRISPAVYLKMIDFVTAEEG